MANQIDLGPVLPIFKGDWVSGTVYERLNIVRHNSAAWVCNVNLIPNEDVALPPGTANSTGKQNWVVLAIDTSAVASVNGATGHVKIDSLEESPILGDNSLRIATTAWVNDKLDNYTDTTIVQVASDIESTVDSSVTAKIETAISAFDSKFDDYIPITGGAVNGSLSFTVASDSGRNCITANINDGYTQMLGGINYAGGAACTLNGKSRPSKPGWVELRATDGTNAASLILKPDGSLLKSGNNVAIFDSSNKLVFPNNTQFWIA